MGQGGELGLIPSRPPVVEAACSFACNDSSSTTLRPLGGPLLKSSTLVLHRSVLQKRHLRRRGLQHFHRRHRDCNKFPLRSVKPSMTMRITTCPRIMTEHHMDHRMQDATSSIIRRGISGLTKIPRSRPRGRLQICREMTLSGTMRV